jgi:hypothetical protein
MSVQHFVKETCRFLSQQFSEYKCHDMSARGAVAIVTKSCQKEKRKKQKGIKHSTWKVRIRVSTAAQGGGGLDA